MNMQFETYATLFIILFGALGHFIFEMSGHRKWAGLFFAVNESTWEHIKLTIYPSLIAMAAEMLIFGWDRLIPTAWFAAMTTMMLLIPAIFYGYTAITGKNWLITDIICFCIAIAAGMYVHHLVENAPEGGCTLPECVLCCAGIGLYTVLYLTLSYHPPHCFLFRDPQNGSYGPGGHNCHSHFHSI